MKEKSISIKRAVVINAIGRYSSVLFHIVFTAIFSRILSPEEFGVIAVINVFVVFFELFSDLGIGTAIIQNQELSKREHGEVFTFTFIIGVALGVTFSMVSRFIALFYNDDVYIKIGELFSLVIMLTAFNIVPDALVMKNKRFKYASFRIVLANLVSYIVALILALKGFSYYSLVIRAILYILIQFIMNVIYIRIRPRWMKSWNTINKIRSYSLYQFGSSLINYFQRNLDNLLVGKYMGRRSLAYYDKSYTFSRYPVSYLSTVITPVLHPILAEHQNNKEYIYKKYMEVVTTLSAIGILISGIFISSSREIIVLLFGTQWEASVMPFEIISFSLWVQMLTGTVGCVMQSLGNTKDLFKMCSISVIFSVVGIAIGVYSKNLSILAGIICIIYYIHFGVYFLITLKDGFSKNFVFFIKDLKKDIIALILMQFFSAFLNKLLSFNSVLLLLFVKLLVVIAFYAVLSLTLLRNNTAILYVRNKLKIKHKT